MNQMSQTLAVKNRKIAVILLGVVIGMFLFATVLMPPLYDAFCELTGLNGKITAPAAAPAITNGAAARPSINVQFVTKTDKDMPWYFRSATRSVKSIPGEPQVVKFTVVNRSNEAMTGRAIPSVSPAHAAQYLRKMECFCFQKQPLGAGESKQMPVRFYFTDDVPENIRDITISYTLYRSENNNG